MTDRPMPQPDFGYEVVLCDDFDDVLSGGASGRRVPVTDLPELADERGALLLQARGGAGKTTALTAAREAAKAGGIRVIGIAALDLALHLPNDEIEEGDVLEALSVASNGEASAQYLLDSPEPALLLVDGVNEVPPSQASALLSVVQHLTERAPSLRAVVTDRLHRRSLPPRAWTLATLTPVADDVVRRLVPADLTPAAAEALSLPFYLKQAVHDGPGSRASMHEQALTLHAAQSKDDIRRLAAATFEQYERTRSRRIDEHLFGARIPEEQLGRLQAAGVLATVGPLRFAHHLISDYLAARHVADKEEWTRGDLDVLTLTATSFDALAMLLELVPHRADELVLAAYDWNFYAAAYLLSEARDTDLPVNPGLETAVLGMLGERRFDRVRATASQVTDALRTHGTDYARALLDAPNRTALAEVVRLHNSDPAWDEWQALFLRPDGAPAKAGDVKLLRHRNPLLGWTAANVLRRSSTGPDVWAAVLALLADKDGTVRWRAAHALGRNPQPQAVEGLLATLERDGYSWARYGALRSLVEIAAEADETLRAVVLDRLAALADLLRSRPELAREAERVLDLRDPPPGWADATAVVIEKLWAEAATVEEQDRWSRLGLRLRQAA